MGHPIIGRERESADVRALVDAAAHRPTVSVLCGEAGIGKTALLETAAGHARDRGYRILRAGPARSGPFALVDGLLEQGGIELTSLPPPLGRALSSAGAADESLIVTALVFALESLTRDGPLLVVVDDADRADAESLRVLTASVRSAAAARVVLLAGARDVTLAARLGLGVARYDIGRLSDDAAARLLAGMRAPRDTRRRHDVLRRAAGNPLAIAVLGDHRARLPVEFTQQVQELPEATRWLLLHAAVADDAEPITTMTRAATGSDDLTAWAPAERIGLITVRNSLVRFRHPLLRAACATGDVDRAHRNLADAATDPYRRVEHLVQCTPGRDERVAAHLEEVAGTAVARTDYLAATRMLQAAAERSGSDETAARRYARAVFTAHRSGYPEWTLELHEKATAMTCDPDIGGVAACGAGFALIHLAQPVRAFEVTARAAQRRPADGQIGLTAVVIAAAAALLTGAAGHRERLPELLATVDHGGRGPIGESMISDSQTDVARASVLAVSDPAATDPAVIHQPPGAGPGELIQMIIAGTVAFLADDSARAATELGAAWDMSSRLGAPGSGLAPFPSTILAMIDSGQWSTADRLLSHVERAGLVSRIPLLQSVVPAFRAILRALRQDGPAPHADGRAPVCGTGMTDSIQQRAAGLAALAVSDHETAYLHFRSMFDDNGDPRHYFLGPRSLPQLALTAARTGRIGAGCRVLQRCREAAGPAPTSRMVMLLAHAAGLLDETDAAEARFRQAIEDPERALVWPLEYAEAQLNLGLWLRSRRRVREARPHLRAARDVFLRLGARAHAEQAHHSVPAGLRAAGELDPETTAFAGLTAQRQMIARLAAGGLSNPQIAERLFLSPRTVGSHLYRIYAQLGVGSRHQLRALIGATFS
ncbi:AAA family ATPase [Actinoplanes sp. NPDC048988]|uniref:helix-turn-helix transcriptional regulator n=1 Tax=Actinoplanes sp. NPDC048988 TaxID=3363901 RepID=UPI00371BC17A